MFWVLFLVWITLMVLVVLDRAFKNKDFEKIPGPKGLFFIANSLDFLMNPVKLFYYFRTLSTTYKNLFKFQLGPKKFVLLYNPEDVEIVVSRTKSKGYLYTFLKPWLQDGLLLSNGSKWQRRRKILTPAFHFNILRHFSLLLEENSRKLVEQIRHEVEKPKTNVGSFITDFTLNSICETSMGLKLDEETSDSGRRYKEGIHTLGQLIVHRAQRVWMYPDYLFSFTNIGRKQKELLHLLSSFRDNVVNQRKETGDFQNFNFDTDADDIDIMGNFGKKRLAMLDLLFQAEKDSIIDVQGIGEEVDTFMFEGHDTTAIALQFAFMLLANNQESQDKVAEECDRIFGSSTRAASMNDLGQMKYIECCIKEAMRLYPPVFFILRALDQPLKLKNYTVPAGVEFAVYIFGLHRRSDQFVEPLEFRPERFLVEPTWHPFAYLPFSAGARNCIGQRFAMMEMKLALSAVLRQYRLHAVTRPHDIVFVADFLLRSRDPIYVKFEKRH